MGWLAVVKKNDFHFKKGWLPGSGTDGLSASIWY
jgi:hypothetical protein